MLRKKRMISAIFVAFAIVVLLSISISVVYATKPIPVSGSINVTGGTVYSIDRAGESDNSVTYLSLKGMFTGDIAGAYTSESRWVNHNVDTPSELWRNVHAVDTISPATVNGKTGTLYLILDSGPGGGSWVIIGGTGDLAGLHGHGTATPAGGGVVNYEGYIHFDPES